MANPFYGEPASPLQALLLGQQSYDKSSKSYLDTQIADMIASGTTDYNKIAALAARGGNLPAALGLMKSGEESKAAAGFQQMFQPGGALYQGGGAPAPPPSPVAQLVAPSPEPAGPTTAQPGQPGAFRFSDVVSAVGPDGVDRAPAMSAVGKPTQVAQAGGVPRQPAMPTITPNPAAGQIPALIAAASNPRLPEGQRKVATTMLEHALKTSDLPPDQKDYALAVAQGEKDDFTTWMRKNKASGAIMVNTAEGLEGAQTKARITIDTEAAKEATKQAEQGRRILPLLDQVIKLADKTPGGWAGPVAATMAKAFSAIGWEVPEGMKNAELLQSVSQRLVPLVREPGPTSERELSVYLNAVPGLMQSQEGRIAVANMTKAIAKRAQEIANVYRNNIGAPDLHEKLAALDKPLIAPEDRKIIEAAVATSGGASGTTKSGVKWTIE